MEATDILEWGSQVSDSMEVLFSNTINNSFVFLLYRNLR
jgi:hypothetical protein